MDKARPNDDILINHLHPGYVDTDMTSHTGPLTPEQGAVAASWLALLPVGEQLKGAFVWHDKTVIDWVSGTFPTAY
jgi:carbonyl reductase 1